MWWERFKTGVHDDFFDKTPKAQEIEAKLDRWYPGKLRNFCIANRKSRKDTEQNEKIIYKLLLQQRPNIQNISNSEDAKAEINSGDKWTKYCNRQFSREI